MNYKRSMVVFNLDNPHQKELYEWCISQSTNFSGFVKSVLFAHKHNYRDKVDYSPPKEDDSSAMVDLL